MKIDPKALTYWRNMRVMTRPELAEAARISLDSLVSYELGRRSPREKIFRRLVTALGIGPENLLLDRYKYIPRIKEDEDYGRYRQGEEEDHSGADPRGRSGGGAEPGS